MIGQPLSRFGQDGAPPPAGVSALVFTIARRYKRGHFVADHAHDWPQLLYASSGIMGVRTDVGCFIIPPQRALWLPVGAVHATWMLTDVDLHSLYLGPSAAATRRDCKVLGISPLLRELILVAQASDPPPPRERKQRLVTQLILHELRHAPSASSPIPMPSDARLLRLCRSVIEKPSIDTTFETLASQAGGSTKTIARLFERELGMSFRRWRDLVLTAHAAAHIAEGRAAKAVASALGYTPSAFSVMMRRSRQGEVKPAPVDPDL